MMTDVRVLGLNGFGLEVPDFEAARKFYGTFGLEVAEHSGSLRLNSPGRKNDEAILVQGEQKRLHHVSFYAAPEMIDPLAERIRSHGLEVEVSCGKSALRDGIWFRDPWGTWINISAHVPGAPREVVNLPSNDPDRRDRVDVAAWQELGAGRPPLRLGHLLMFTQDWEKSEEFYCNVLGLRVTDRAAGKVSFMAAGSGIIDHHCFGLINSTHRGFQHASFQVGGFDDIGLGTWRMMEAGFRESHGPGRHAIASNLFQYIRDPWGSWVEYYADMDKISDSWVSRDWKSLPYIWGPEWSPEFWAGQMNRNFEPR